MCTKHLARKIQMGFCEGDFSSNAHMCLIYKNDEERKSVIKKFITAGFECNERIEYFYDVWNEKQIQNELINAGVERSNVENLSQLRFYQANQAYHPDGYFSPESMWQKLCNCFNNGIQDGYEGVRLSGEMTWSLKNVPGSEKLIEYESGINQLINSHPMAIICQYDANQFNGATLMEVLRVHPYMIAQSRIVINPYYEGQLKFK